jgi:hypothetical protein
MNRMRFVVLVCVTLMLGCSHRDTRPVEVQAADAKWLALVDSDQYKQSWEDASPVFQAFVSEAKWEGAMDAAKPPLGKTLSRKFQKATPTRTIPGVPDGTYLVVEYESKFENKFIATETVITSLDKDGVWRVAGYFIR